MGGQRGNLISFLSSVILHLQVLRGNLIDLMTMCSTGTFTINNFIWEMASAFSAAGCIRKQARIQEQARRECNYIFFFIDNREFNYMFKMFQIESQM